MLWHISFTHCCDESKQDNGPDHQDIVSRAAVAGHGVKIPMEDIHCCREQETAEA
jgi:hypothetical protein